MVFPSGSHPGGFAWDLRGKDGRVTNVVLAAKTGGRGHYTLWGCARLFLELVVDVRVAAG